MQNQANLLSIGDASEYLGVSIDTLRRWEKRGKVQTYRSPGGHRYFYKNELDKLFGKKYERDEESNLNETKPAEPQVNEVTPPPQTAAIQPLTPSVYPTFEVSQVEVTETTKNENRVLERPLREFTIPVVQAIRIKQETITMVQKSEEPYNLPRGGSVLIPNSESTNISPQPEKEVKNNTKQETSEKKNGKNIYMVIIIGGLITVIIILFVLLLGKSQPLSPIP